MATYHSQKQASSNKQKRSIKDNSAIYLKNLKERYHTQRSVLHNVTTASSHELRLFLRLQVKVQNDQSYASVCRLRHLEN